MVVAGWVAMGLAMSGRCGGEAATHGWYYPPEGGVPMHRLLPSATQRGGGNLASAQVGQPL